jgi:branched-chain amino acid transport system permease protein
MRHRPALFTIFRPQKTSWQAIVFSLAGAIAGLAGSLYTFHQSFGGPNMLGVVLSTQIVLYALFGGVGTLIGAVIGVIAIEIVSFWLGSAEIHLEWITVAARWIMAEKL